MIGLAFAAALASFLFATSGGDSAMWLGDGAVMAGSILCLWRAQAVPQERTAWLLIGLGVLSWLAGDCYWNIALSTLASPPTPSPADVGYVLFYPLVGAGLFLQIRRAAGRFPQGFVFDWILGGLAILAVVSASVLPGVLTTSGGDLAEVLTNLAYPVGDLMLIAVLVGAIQLNDWRPQGAWAVFGLGLLLTVTGDIIFLYLSAEGSYVGGGPLDALWTFGMLTIGFAAWCPIPTRLHREGRWETTGPLAVFALAALSIVAWDHVSPLSSVAVALADLTLLAVVLRLLWSLVANGNLVSEREREALTDAVTELPNHRALTAVVESELERSRRYGRPLAVLFVDLDYFKSVNDLHGHDAGDRTLAEFGELVSGSLREIDTIARFGGEEFVAVLPEVSLQQATESAERIRQVVADHSFSAIAGIRLTCSIGVAELAPLDRYDDLLGRADAAMYEAKRRGRDRVVAAGPGSHRTPAEEGGRTARRPVLAAVAGPAPAAPAEVELDPVASQFRLDAIPASVKVTAMLFFPIVLYAATEARPGSRVALMLLAAAALIGSLFMLRLPWPRILSRPRGEAVIAIWWLLDFAAIMGAATLDGGPRSPLLMTLFVLLVFMGFSYPRPMVVLLAAVAVAGYATLVLAYGEDPGRALFVAAALAGTGVMSYWQSITHEQRHAELTSSKRDLELLLRSTEQSRRSLELGEQRLAEAQAIAHIGSWEWEHTTNRMVVSAEMLRILGLRLEEFDSTIEGYLECVHVNDRVEVADRMDEARRLGAAFSYEHRITRPDGAVRLLLMHGEAVLDADSHRGLRGICEDLTELRAVESRLQRLAEHDEMTGLLNRRRLLDELDRELARPRAAACPGALIMLDIDEFGFYNASFGPAAGDALLRAFAGVLSASHGAHVLARSGGDEFAVILSGTSETEAGKTAAQLCDELGSCAPGAPVTVSCGIAMLGPDISADEVLAGADVAMHAAKANGQRVTVHDRRAGGDISWVQRVRTALQEDRFVLYGQPVFDLTTGDVSHHELLIRMLDDQGGVIAPGEFLPAAERYGLINEVDRWVIATAIELARSGESVAANISARSIGDRGIVQALANAVADGLDPAKLMFEITETAAVSNLSQAREFAVELMARGL